MIGVLPFSRSREKEKPPGSPHLRSLIFFTIAITSGGVA